MIAFVVMMVVVSVGMRNICRDTICTTCLTVVMVVILAVTVRMVAMTVPMPRVLVVIAAAGHGENSLLMSYTPH